MVFNKNDFESGNTKEEDGFRVNNTSVLSSLSVKSSPFKLFDYDDSETGEVYYRYLRMSRASSNNETEMVGLFKYLSDNSSMAEWRLNKYTNYSLELSTFHSYDTSPNDNHLKIIKDDILWMVHSYPNTAAGRESKSFGGDASASTFYKSYFVYFPRTSLLYRLSEISDSKVRATKMEIRNSSRRLHLGLTK